MVRVEEIEDEAFVTTNEKDFEDDDDFTDTDSEISTFSEDDTTASSVSESLTDRILALRDIVSPTTRRRISTTTSNITSYVKSGLWFGGKSMWVISTSALLLGVPFALALVEEQQYVEMEKEQKVREMGNELLTPGATSSIPVAGPAL